MKNQRVDICIVGGGMVGLTAASLLSRAGFDVALIEGAAPPEFDEAAEVGLRVSALSPGSVNILSEAGAWRQISRHRHCDFQNMHVEDVAKDVMGDHNAEAGDTDIESSSIDFCATEFALDSLGVIVENGLVQWALWNSLEAMGSVDIYCPERLVDFDVTEQAVSLNLESGASLECALLVGADGPDSRVREKLGITQEQWVYAQKGLVTVVECERPNPATAWQRFIGGNPLAFLPLADGRSSIVWTLPEVEADRLLALEEDQFREKLGMACGHWLGDVLDVGLRAAFPLGMRLSDSYVGPRTVLLGDAAHVVHPMAGQGVNIGLQDVAGLVESLVNARRDKRDIGKGRELERFARWRRSESEIMARGIHGIKSLFSIPLLAPLRKPGMALVSKSWLAREAFIVRAAGLHRNAAALSRGTTLQELVHSGD